MSTPVDDPDRLRRLVDAVLAIGSDLSLPVTLRHIVEAARSLVSAKYGALGVLDESGHGLAQFVNSGLAPDVVEQIGDLPEGHGILGLLIIDPRPLRLADLRTHADSYGFPAAHPPMTSFLGVPIRVRGQVFGNLYLTDKEGATEFSEDDEALAVALAGGAAIAIDNARLHARVRDFALIEDRERIAADLHDTVIQRLFATGLTLEAAVRIAPPDLAERIEQAVSGLDDTIRQIRSSIFALTAPRATPRGLREQVLVLTAEASANLGYEPHLLLEGPIDAAVSDDVAAHLLAVVREALSNVVKHAHAGSVEVSVRAEPGDELVVTVTDDGVGATTTSRPGGHGVGNMTKRADALGGDMKIALGPAGKGTTLIWRVPLHRR